MRQFVLYGIFLLVGMLPATAQAQYYSFGVMTGQGIDDIYNFGFGARFGKDFIDISGFRLPYVGIIGVFHQGTTETPSLLAETGRQIVELNRNGAYYGGEAGLSYVKSKLTIDASVVFAFARLSRDQARFDARNFFTGVDKESQTDFFTAPGLRIAIPFGAVSIGGEARYLNVPDYPSWAFYFNMNMGKWD